MSTEILTDYIRVTDILRPFTKLDEIDPEIVNRAAARGQFVHDCIGGHVNGLGYPPIPQKWKGYIDSYEKWKQFGAKPQLFEERFYSKEYMLTGQIDMYLENTIIDFKTSSKYSKTWPLQLAAYKFLMSINKKEAFAAKIIHLSKEGKEPTIYEFSRNELDKALELFMGAYECYMALLK